MLARVNRFTRRQAAARRLGINRLRFGGLAEHPPERIRFRDGWLSLKLPNDDPSILEPLINVLLDDCYGVRRLQGAQRILDVGAHVGVFAVAARLAQPSALIHCYEPSPAVWPQLDHQGAASGATVYHEAVGGHDAQVGVEVFAEGAIHTRTHELPGGQIHQVAFEEAVSRMGGRIDLAKVDCEAAEWDFLRSPAWARVDRLAMEYHLWTVPPHTHAEVQAAVRALGFRITHWQPQKTYGMAWAER